MNGYVTAAKNTGNDRQAIQTAIDQAKKQDTGTVVIPEGEWILDGSLRIPGDFHLILDGAVLRNGSEEGTLLCNSHANEDYGRQIYYAQEHITISGRNGAKLIGGGILLSNVSFSKVEGLEICETSKFAVLLLSTMAVKIQNMTFTDCDNAVALGVGVRDGFFLDLKGNVKYHFFVMSDFLFEERRRFHRDHTVFNHIVRNVQAEAETFAYLYGHHVERIVFCDVRAKVSDVAFRIKQGEHITFSNVQAEGKLLSSDVKESAVFTVQ